MTDSTIYLVGEYSSDTVKCHRCESFNDVIVGIESAAVYLNLCKGCLTAALALYDMVTPEDPYIKSMHVPGKEKRIK